MSDLVISLEMFDIKPGWYLVWPLSGVPTEEGE